VARCPSLRPASSASGRPVGGISDKPLRLEAEALLGSLDHGLCRTDLGHNWTVRAEYLYYRLSGKSNLATNPVFPAFPILFSWNATDTHTVRVGVNYKFGGPVVARY
jgi:hypothetical protein